MKLHSVRALIVAGLLLGMAGCGSGRPLTRWRPGIYSYQSTLPGTGEVAGSIEVVDDGPISVSSNLGVCDERIETTPRGQRERLDGELVVRTFICGTEHRITVRLGRFGGPPIEGSISNQRTDTVYTYGEPICRQYKTVDSEEGTDRVCAVWDSGPRMQARTTGATARWSLVTVPFAPRP
jgi:hypothetical protein